MKLIHIFISPEHNYFGHHGRPSGRAPLISLEEAEVVAGQGIVGDRFFGWKEDYSGQVTFFSIEAHDALCAQLGVWDRGPEVYRRNLIVRGADLNALIGREFELQGMRFEGASEAKPCFWMDEAFGPGAEEALRGRGGLRARVLTGGSLKCER
ncbi:MAG: MOSC domain-containing protein [Verrucomicrobiales bacterium]